MISQAKGLSSSLDYSVTRVCDSKEDPNNVTERGENSRSKWQTRARRRSEPQWSVAPPRMWAANRICPLAANIDCPDATTVTTVGGDPQAPLTTEPSAGHFRAPDLLHYGYPALRMGAMAWSRRATMPQEADIRCLRCPPSHLEEGAERSGSPG